MKRLQFIWRWPVYVRLEWPFRQATDWYSYDADDIEYRVVLSFDQKFFRRFRPRTWQWPPADGEGSWVCFRSWAFGPLEVRYFPPLTGTAKS